MDTGDPDIFIYTCISYSIQPFCKWIQETLIFSFIHVYPAVSNLSVNGYRRPWYSHLYMYILQYPTFSVNGYWRPWYSHLYMYILQYPTFLLMDTEGPDLLFIHVFSTVSNISVNGYWRPWSSHLYMYILHFSKVSNLSINGHWKPWSSHLYMYILHYWTFL